MDTSQLDTSEWLEIGTIVAPQGLKGELRVNPTTDFPERFEKPGLRWLQKNNQQPPESVKLLKGYQIPGKNIYVVSLEGVEDRDQAEAIRGCKLLVPIEDRLELSEDEYHVLDLIGKGVYHQQTQEVIGTVVDVFSAGNDLLKVRLSQPEANPQGKSPFVLIPFVKEIVPVVNLEENLLEINPPAGLLEIIQFD